MEIGVAAAMISLVIAVGLGLYHRFRVTALGDTASSDRFAIPLAITIAFFYMTAFSLFRPDQSGGPINLFAYEGYALGGIIIGALAGIGLGLWTAKAAKMWQDAQTGLIQAHYWGWNKFVLALSLIPPYFMLLLLRPGEPEFARDVAIAALVPFWIFWIFFKNVGLLWRYSRMASQLR
jgi:hypothetical protein